VQAEEGQRATPELSLRQRGLTSESSTRCRQPLYSSATPAWRGSACRRRTKTPPRVLPERAAPQAHSAVAARRREEAHGRLRRGWRMASRTLQPSQPPGGRRRCQREGALLQRREQRQRTRGKGKRRKRRAALRMWHALPPSQGREQRRRCRVSASVRREREYASGKRKAGGTQQRWSRSRGADPAAPAMVIFSAHTP